MYVRQPVLTALFGRLNCDLLPFGLFLRRAFGIDMHNRAIGNDRAISAAPISTAFAHQVHVFSLWICLSEDDPALQRRSFRFVQFSQCNFIAAKIDDFRGDFASASVEEKSFSPTLMRRTSRA